MSVKPNKQKNRGTVTKNTQEICAFASQTISQFPNKIHLSQIPINRNTKLWAIVKPSVALYNCTCTQTLTEIILWTNRLNHKNETPRTIIPKVLQRSSIILPKWIINLKNQKIQLYASFTRHCCCWPGPLQSECNLRNISTFHSLGTKARSPITKCHFLLILR